MSAGASPWSRRRFLGASASLPLLAACGTRSADDPGGGPIAASPPTPTAGPRPVRYGSAPAQFGELWWPEGDGPFAVVVLVHGGFWRAGYDLSLMDGLAADAVAAGWAVWNIEYRRVGEEGGGWPGTFADVAAAVDHLAVLADVDGEPLDPARTAIVGHSAGGHLATWVAARPGLPADAPGAAPAVRPVAAVSQAGVVDLRRAATDRLGGTATVDLLGGTPEDRSARYGLVSPIERLPLGIPVRCVHGRRDDIVPLDQSERFVTAALAAGDDAVLAAFDGDHFDVVDAAHPSWAATVGWLRPHLRR